MLQPACFRPGVVDRQDLTNAIALNSTMFNTATVIGPALAGLTYAAFGPQWCFIINGLSFLAVIAALVSCALNLSSQLSAGGQHCLKSGKA
jgi:MFS family permease